MKATKILLLVGLLAAAAGVSAQEDSYGYGHENGATEVMHLDSKEMNMQRDILVHTPYYYAQDSLTHYDVMYVFDAQTSEMFDMAYTMIDFASDESRNYIVVGIVSPAIDSLHYYRNNDLLPAPINVDPKTFYGGYYGGADKLMGFLKNEVMPYIDAHYRTTTTKIGIGHSLGASFILYSFLQDPDTYDVYLALSPNLEYDKDRLADGLVNFDYAKITSNKFLYIDNANEEKDWPEWKPAREKIYRFLDSVKLPANLTFAVNHFPNETHWSSFPVALSDAMERYFKYADTTSTVRFSKETYPVHIVVTVPDKTDTVYMTGNQSVLGDWQPEKGVLMTRRSDFEREATVEVHFPLEVNFTRGSWKSESLVTDVPWIYYYRLWIDPRKAKDYHFKIEMWSDRQ